MTIGTWVLISVVALAIIGFIVNGRKKLWYKVYLSNNEVMTVYRTMADWWFRDSSTIMGFRLIDGRRVKIVKRWVIKVEEDIDVRQKEK